jgi:WD40 repeat protein
MPTVRRQRTFRRWRDSLRALAFSPDGRTLAAHFWGHTIRLWDVGTGTTLTDLRKRRRLCVRSPTGALAFSPDGRTLAVVVGDEVRLWDLPARRLRTTIEGHRGLVWGLTFTPDGRTLLTTGNDGTVRTWDPATGQPRAAFDWGIGKVYALALAPDGMRAFAGGDGGIAVWDLD